VQIAAPDRNIPLDFHEVTMFSSLEETIKFATVGAPGTLSYLHLSLSLSLRALAYAKCHLLCM
jgi:hypothetical protein